MSVPGVLTVLVGAGLAGLSAVCVARFRRDWWYLAVLWAVVGVLSAVTVPVLLVFGTGWQWWALWMVLAGVLAELVQEVDRRVCGRSRWRTVFGFWLLGPGMFMLAWAFGRVFPGWLIAEVIAGAVVAPMWLDVWPPGRHRSRGGVSRGAVG